MSNTPKTVAMIGLDSSHTIEYTRRMQDPGYPAANRVSRIRTATCLRFPSPFQSEPDQDKRQAILEGWGVRVTRDFDEAVAGCDAIFMPINDPAAHLPWFERCAALGKPVFLDKPMADSIASGRRIAALAAEHGVPFFSTSSLRYDIDFTEAAFGKWLPIGLLIAATTSTVVLSVASCRIAPTTTTPEMALVTDISGVCSACATLPMT